MLSRVADSLYWMSRYLERAEHTARVLAVGVTQTLDHNPEDARARWMRLYEALNAGPLPAGTADGFALSQALTLNTQAPNSIVNCILLARENARQVREQISSEMWEELNQLYLRVRAASSQTAWQGESIDFYQAVKQGSHLFQGITDATMSHGEGWFFIQVGRYLERAGATARLLDAYFLPFLYTNSDQPMLLEFNDWVALLKCGTAFEAYCKVYTADVQPSRVAEYLLLDAELPRSVRFSADRVQRALQSIAQTKGSRGAGRAERLAGRLRAALDYGQIDEIMADDMHAYLDNVRRQCADIHSAIYQTYVAYSVETALAS